MTKTLQLHLGLLHIILREEMTISGAMQYSAKQGTLKIKVQFCNGRLQSITKSVVNTL